MVLQDGCMTDPETTARRLLDEIQEATAAKDAERLAGLFAEDVVLFGTAAANIGRHESITYLHRVLAQEGTIRWHWKQVEPLLAEPEVICFAVVGSVGFESADGEPEGQRDAFRLTILAVQESGQWRVRHFHGSVPQTD
jgi:uncharacterized protein (TIGR02246 family)